jgi:hypothetical protein
MAAKKKAKTQAKGNHRTRRLGPFDYIVSVISGRVVIEGLNDGNIYGKPDQPVTFSCGPRVRSFTFEATDFKPNDSKRKSGKKWPFKEREPTWPQPGFSGALRSPGLLKKRATYKYSISVRGAIAADPVIIVDR